MELLLKVENSWNALTSLGVAELGINLDQLSRGARYEPASCRARVIKKYENVYSGTWFITGRQFKKDACDMECLPEQDDGATAKQIPSSYPHLTNSKTSSCCSLCWSCGLRGGCISRCCPKLSTSD